MFLRGAEGLRELFGKKSSPLKNIKGGILSYKVKSYSKKKWEAFMAANLGPILSYFAPELEIITPIFKEAFSLSKDDLVKRVTDDPIEADDAVSRKVRPYRLLMFVTLLQFVRARMDYLRNKDTNEIFHIRAVIGELWSYQANPAPFIYLSSKSPDGAIGRFDWSVALDYDNGKRSIEVPGFLQALIIFTAIGMSRDENLSEPVKFLGILSQTKISAKKARWFVCDFKYGSTSKLFSEYEKVKDLLGNPEFQGSQFDMSC
jgi:hypothetical protein